MMKDYFEGWEDKADVQIPERKQKGFQDRIVVRKPVEPVREKKTGRGRGIRWRSAYRSSCP